MTQTVLAIDVGNTRAKCGLLSVSSNETLPECLQVVSTPDTDDFDWNEIEDTIRQQKLEVVRSVVSGSNPTQLDRILADWPSSLDVPQRIRLATDLRLKLDVDEPGAVGLDRALNAVAANLLRRSDQPAIVIDSGTATTVDLITADGTFAGGTILPGIELSAKALHHYTALLPLIEMKQLDPDVRPPGRNTHDAIQNGILFGHIGAIREIVEQLKHDAHKSPALLLTGGAGKMLSPHLPETDYLEFLALRALGTVSS